MRSANKAIDKNPAMDPTKIGLSRIIRPAGMSKFKDAKSNVINEMARNARTRRESSVLIMFILLIGLNCWVIKFHT